VRKIIVAREDGYQGRLN